MLKVKVTKYLAQSHIASKSVVLGFKCGSSNKLPFQELFSLAGVGKGWGSPYLPAEDWIFFFFQIILVNYGVPIGNCLEVLYFHTSF